jgi:hypothetical protein
VGEELDHAQGEHGRTDRGRPRVDPEKQTDVLHHDGDRDGGQDDHAELDLDRRERVERPHRAASGAA